MNSKSIAGKTALVTGASQSIGLACARHLAEDGASVVIMGRGEARLKKAREELVAAAPGARIEMFVGDACRESELKAALEFANGLQQRLDILVPTVGGGNMKPILMRDVDSVRQEIEVNYISVFLMIRHGVPLLQRDGSIVCISTIGVTQPFWGLGLYGAAKAAMERMVKAAAFELGAAGIRVNAVRPGMTVAPEVLDKEGMAEMYENFVNETSLGRLGNPDDIARVVRFLAGPESGWVTGQIFSADGGLEQGKAPDNMDAFFGKEVMDRVRSGHSIENSEDLPSAVSTSLADPKS